MNLKEYYSEMIDSELCKRIEQYVKFDSSGFLDNCDLRNDIEKYSEKTGCCFSTGQFGVINCLLLEGSIRYKKFLRFKN